jgi:hypothetical protein
VVPNNAAFHAKNHNPLQNCNILTSACAGLCEELSITKARQKMKIYNITKHEHYTIASILSYLATTTSNIYLI